MVMGRCLACSPKPAPLSAPIPTIVVLRARLLTVALAIAALAATAWPAMRIGAEFMPSLDEGTLFYMPVTLPGLCASARKVEAWWAR